MSIPKGKIINDQLSCIENTKTFWHDLLENISGLEDGTNGYTPFHLLAKQTEEICRNNPDIRYIIRNGTFFPVLNLPGVKQISLIQDDYSSNPPMFRQQIEVANNSDMVVFNSPVICYNYKQFVNKPVTIIPLGTDVEKFRPLTSEEFDREEFMRENDIKPDSIIFVGAATDYPKGFDTLMKIVEKTNYNFIFVMKDDYKSNNPRIKVFNRIEQEVLTKLFNSCYNGCIVGASRYESLGLGMVEALSCDLPLVTNNVGIFYGDNWSPKLGVQDYGVNLGGCSNIVDEFINWIDFVMNVRSGKIKHEFTPRKWVLENKLDKETCMSEWLKLVERIVQ
jgi:glycosyltransferase involved in cell wall biosynthesis